MESVLLILTLLLLLGGFLLTTRLRLREGSAFFILMLFSRLISMYFDRYIQRLADHDIEQPTEASLEKMGATVDMVTHIISFVALLLLVIGFYNLWRRITVKK